MATIFVPNQRPVNLIGGCLTWFLSFSLLAVVVSGVIRGCTSQYAHACRIAKSDPCTAAHLFAEVARTDHRGDSINSVIRLTQLPGDCSLREMIALIDLPNGRNIGESARGIIWEEIRKRTKNAVPSPPKYYDFAGEQETRNREKVQWLEWFDSTHQKS